MGNVQNPTKVSQGTMLTIQQEYKKVSKSQSLKKSLTISQLFRVKTPENNPFTFCHIGVLFVCDKQLDSVFSLNDIVDLARWIQQRLYGVPSYQFKSQLQTEALDDLITFILVAENEKRIVEWVVGMLVKDEIPPHHEGYVKISQLKLIYDIFNIKTMNNMDYQYFVNLVRKAAEQMGYQIMEAYENEELEEYISVIVCQHFVKCFLKGMKKIVKQIGFDKPISGSQN